MSENASFALKKAVVAFSAKIGPISAVQYSSVNLLCLKEMSITSKRNNIQQIHQDSN